MIFNNFSLKVRMTLFTLIIFLISIWSLTFFAGHTLREEMEHLLGDQQVTAVSMLAAQVNHDLVEKLTALESVAGRVSPAMLADPPSLQTFLEERPILQGMFNGGILAVGIDGTAIADVPVSTRRIGVNYLDIDVIAAALKEGKASVGRPIIGKKLLVPVFGMAVPIRDAESRVIGALSGVTNLGKANFLDKVCDNRYGKTGGYVLLIPEHRLIITATDKSRIMQPLPAPGIHPRLDNFLQGYEGSTVYINPLGVEVLGSAKGIPVANWLLGVTLPTAEAFAPIRAMQQRILLVAIFMTLLVGAVTWWMLKSQLFPLLAATKTLAALADTSQPPQPLPITSQDEIGELIYGFNRLLQALGQREEALKRSEKLYRLLTENIKDVVWTLDIETMYFRYVSPSVEKLRGYTPEEILAEPVTKGHTPEAAEYLTNLIHSRAKAFSSGEEPPDKFYTDEVERPCKNGSTVWIEVNTNYYINPETGQVELLGVTRDITERKLVDAALRESEVRLAQSHQIMAGVLEHTHMMAVFLDQRFNFIWVNRAYADTGGHEPSFFVGKNHFDLYPHAENQAIFQGVVDSGKPFFVAAKPFEFPDQPERSTTWWDWSLIPVKDAAAKVTGLVFTLLEVTELKRAEIALQTSLAEKEVLLKEVHHRVKNNLAAIMGLVDMQRQTMADTSARTAMTELSTRIRSMSLVHEQLYHSDNLARVDFQQYLETLISHLCLSYDQTGVHVSVAGAGVTMGLDTAVPCGLLITELMTNAFKYAFPGGQPRPGAEGCEIAVSASWDGTAYTLAVADNGVGLPEDFDWKTTETLGLMLVGMLGEHQLQGKVDLDCSNGTKFRLRFEPKDNDFSKEQFHAT